MGPYLKFRLQRAGRKIRRDIWLWQEWLTDYFNRHIWGKWRQLGIIRRLVIIWWGAVILLLIGLWSQITGLGSYYLVRQPLPGGVYIEGEVGQVHNLNPILPEPGPAQDINRLIFDGLTRIDPQRGLEGDLARSWSVSSDGLTYTFNLRHGVKWQDGVPFTARDVVFTLVAIQNPDSRSPLANSWQGVKAVAKDDYTVEIKLPNPYTPFIYSTTVGILPSHLLENTDPSQLRISGFNQQPIGTGPFKLKSFVASAGEIQLIANSGYFGGAPKLDGFNFRMYDNQSDLDAAYVKRQVTAIARLYQPGSELYAGLQQHQLSLTNQTDLFLRTNQSILSDVAVRQALAAATDRQDIISRALNGYGVPLELPLLPGSPGYSTANLPPAYNPTAAAAQLAADGWQKTGSGLVKNGQPLRLKLVTGNDSSLVAAANSVKQQWGRIGVKVDITSVDLNELEQSYIRPRNYDVLLFGIDLGADPDVYTYWHSSQADDPGLNLSRYADSAADKALESGRLLTDPDERAAKYHSFLQAWVKDEPAIVLYTPFYTYATNPSVAGIQAKLMIEPSDRFYDVQSWTVSSRWVAKISN